MRLVDAVVDFRQNWRSRTRRRILRLRNNILGGEQLQPGHTYQDTLSNESLHVRSVGSQVQFERTDVDVGKMTSTSKDMAQLALDLDLLVHDQHRCPGCPNMRR